MDFIPRLLAVIDDERCRRTTALRMLWDDDRGRYVWRYGRVGALYGRDVAAARGWHERGLRAVLRHVCGDPRLRHQMERFEAARALAARA